MMVHTAARLTVWLGIVVTALLTAPSVRPADSTLRPFGEALTVGCLTGLGLFFALARRRLPDGIRAIPRRTLVARSFVLLARSAHEEAVWRAFALGLLAGPFGRLTALVVSTALFAGAHVRRQGRFAAVHVVTGAVFGLVYLLTGRLHAAIAAHGVYNVLIGTATLARPELSVSDTGSERTCPVASVAPPRRRVPIPRRSSKPFVTSIASLEGVVRSFGAVQALDGIDLELRRGEILALLGPNGAGKSTAVSIMLGLRRTDAGKALLFGLDPRDPAARLRVGAVLQDVSFPPGLRVRETVGLVRAHFPNAPSTEEVLDRLALASLADRDAAGLSGGQRRRLAVALALAGNPEALFLDEPTAGMDASARRSLLRDIVDFAAQGGAVLLTTQQLAEAEEIATRVVLLSGGRVTLDGTVGEMRACGGVTRVAFRASALPALDGIVSADSYDDRHVVYVEDADAFVAGLVRSEISFRELEVAPSSLEDAFVALTTVEPE